MNAAERIATIQAEHDAARRTAGVTRRGRMTGLADQLTAGTAGDAERVASREDAASLARVAERERHAEAVRLFERATAITAAIDACDGDDYRAARLDMLRETVLQRRAAYIDATYQVQATDADWAPGGRFDRYARRYDLGFLAYDPADILQDAAESLALRHHHAVLNGDPVLPQGEAAPNGSRTLPHTIGDGYRAIKAAYRRGLGFYGYARRGVVVERDDSERGYTVHESDTVAYIREAGEMRAAIVARVMSDTESLFTSDAVVAAWPDEIDADDTASAMERRQLAQLIERRRAALATLARRFPLTGDARQLALATLLAEGYTVSELTADTRMPSDERTLQNWARELGQLVA